MSVYVNIEKEIGSFHLKVCFEADSGTLALLGASGCGKSMTLKCIAGVERPDRGKIVLDGRILFDSQLGIDLPPQKRDIGLLFQNYALFPHMTVAQNIYAGTVKLGSRKKRASAAADMLERFDIQALANHRPHQLSGGQQQRVALARILVSNPQLLLLDEPFSALDSHLRLRLAREVQQIIRQFGKTVLLVSHERSEVHRMADRVAVMRRGRIDTIGTKDGIFTRPPTVCSATLTGCQNISPITRLDDYRALALAWGVVLALPECKTDVCAIGVHAHGILPGPGTNAFRCRVIEEQENPFSVSLTLIPAEGGAAPIHCETDKALWRTFRANTAVFHIPPQSILCLKD